MEPPHRFSVPAGGLVSLLGLSDDTTDRSAETETDSSLLRRPDVLTEVSAGLVLSGALRKHRFPVSPSFCSWLSPSLPPTPSLPLWAHGGPPLNVRVLAKAYKDTSHVRTEPILRDHDLV